VALPPWTRHALDKACADRVAGIREHDRHRAGRLLQRRHGRATTTQDDIRLERDQFRGVAAKAVGIAQTPAIVDVHVEAGSPTKCLQPLHEGRAARLPFRIVRS
jgi:hypothetical protein